MPTPTAVEKMAEDVFKAMNMATHRARNSTVKRGNIFVSQSNDIFGVYDLIAIDPVVGHSYHYQITRSRGAATARRRKIEKWVEEHDFSADAWKVLSVGILIYATQRSRVDARKVDRFFYREHYSWEWVKLPPLEVK